MDLNEHQHFAQIDREDMLGHIMGLPLQLEKAWHLGKKQPLTGIQPVERIILAGMGGSAIGGDLLASYAADQLEVPLIVTAIMTCRRALQARERWWWLLLIPVIRKRCCRLSSEP